MANKTPLASWLYSKREELNPRFKEFNWPKQWLTELFDFSTTITWNGITVEGQGVDERREIALEKSVAEAIERLICLSKGFDSVGFAVAGTHDPANHARNEALERFYLRKHIRDQIPFQVITHTSPSIDNFLRNHPTSFLDFYRMKTPSNLFGVVCVITASKTLKTSLGFALSGSLEDSMRRSMFEALPSYAWLVNTNNQQDGHLPWHLTPEFLNQILPLLKTKTQSDSEAKAALPKLKKVAVNYDNITVLKSAPIQLARFMVSSAEVTT